jgi:predicted acylesterase/phospholipase RssA
MSPPASVVFQSAKLGEIPAILAEFEWAQSLLASDQAFGRIYGVSGGALVALAFGLALAARREPDRFGRASEAVGEFAHFLRGAPSRRLRSRNLNPAYGPFNLRPLRRWLRERLRAYSGREDLRLSELGLGLYLCALDHDATFTLFGPPDGSLHFPYTWVRVGPPQDALVLEALTASLSTTLSTEPAVVNGDWFRDCRPAIAHAGAIVADLEAADPRPIVCLTPYTPTRNWKLNWITSSFIMHSHHERNQALLAEAYLDLLGQTRAVESELAELSHSLARPDLPSAPAVKAPVAGHVYLPYVGSTEAFTNMRQSVERKDDLMRRFRELLDGQLDDFPFDQPANVIYGAGGFSGILAGLVTTRAVDAGFGRGGGQVRQVYGVSAGVLNGFFHAVQLAAARHPDLYTPAARNALADLERFFEAVEPGKIARLNRSPRRFWKGWANLQPLESFLLERLAAYTGSKHPNQITFDDIALPLTVAAARGDGFTDFLGMTLPERRMRFGGREHVVLAAPVARAMIAGWSMNTYITPTVLGDQAYRDGGGSFYDPGLFVACLDAELTNLLNIHLDEPEGHSYHIPPRPNLVRILFETHNYNFPEERRRMRFLTDLLYRYHHLRARFGALRAQAPPEIAARHPLPPDLRKEWRAGDRSQESGVTMK